VAFEFHPPAPKSARYIIATCKVLELYVAGTVDIIVTCPLIASNLARKKRTLNMSTVTSSTVAHIRASFGSWPMDRNISDVSPYKPVHLTSRRFIAIFQDKYMLKLFDDNPKGVEKELRMMLLAGDDCSVTPLGRVFEGGKLCGILMPYERPVVPPSPDPFYVPLVSNEFSRSDRLKIIHQLCALVSRLHEKGILHGDIKPSNLLLCSDGELRFCDFGDAAVEGEGDIPRAMSVRYSSPFISRTTPLVSLSKAEDIYATGISIWEIYTGRIPFDDVVDEDEVEDIIGSGVRPDVTLIDDTALTELVVSYLDSGDRSFYKDLSS